MKVTKIIWKNDDNTLDLLTFEPAVCAITTPAYHLSTDDLLALRRACDDCLTNHILTAPAESQPVAAEKP